MWGLEPQSYKIEKCVYSSALRARGRCETGVDHQLSAGRIPAHPRSARGKGGHSKGRIRAIGCGPDRAFLRNGYLMPAASIAATAARRPSGGSTSAMRT